jgi:hypothetical protein
MTAAECRRIADREFADVRSLADVPRLSPERLERFKELLAAIEREVAAGISAA